MTEYHNGVEGNWVREFTNGANWNKGDWRQVHLEETYYRDGLVYDLQDDKTYPFSTLGSVLTTNYWERFVPVVKLPVESGLYRDNDGDLWTLSEDGVWSCFTEDDEWATYPTDRAGDFLPFKFIADLRERD